MPERENGYIFFHIAFTLRCNTISNREASRVAGLPTIKQNKAK